MADVAQQIESLKARIAAKRASISVNSEASEALSLAEEAVMLMSQVAGDAVALKDPTKVKS